MKKKARVSAVGLLLTMCWLLALNRSAGTIRHAVPTVGKRMHHIKKPEEYSAFWSRVDCVDLTCWKSEQLRKVLKLTSQGKELVTTNFLPATARFSCSELAIPCTVQKDGKCVVAVSQKDICCFDKALSSQSYKSELIIVTHGHDKLGSPVTVHEDHDPWTFQCFEHILDNEIVSTYFVSQHKTNFTHKKLDFLPIGLGTGKLKADLSVENLNALLTRMVSDLETSCRERKCTLFPAAVNMNTEGSKTKDDRAAAFFHAQRLFPFVENMYGTVSGAQMFEQYSQSALVFSPKGTHFDCWRHYETILMGSIPVVDDHFTLRRILADLPVIFVENWQELTLEALIEEIQRTLAVRHFDLERLSSSFWLQRLLG